MKKLFVFLLLCPAVFTLLQAQDATVKSRQDEVMGIINEHTDPLNSIAENLELHKEELSERRIVLKYHQGNKEVSVATNEAIDRISSYHDQALAKVNEYQSVWFDQTRNLISIYTRYGELKEATGGGTTELDDFKKAHDEYLTKLEAVKTDLGLIQADCAYLKQ